MISKNWLIGSIVFFIVGLLYLIRSLRKDWLTMSIEIRIRGIGLSIMFFLLLIWCIIEFINFYLK